MHYAWRRIYSAITTPVDNSRPATLSSLLRQANRIGYDFTNPSRKCGSSFSSVSGSHQPRLAETWSRITLLFNEFYILCGYYSPLHSYCQYFFKTIFIFFFMIFISLILSIFVITKLTM